MTNVSESSGKDDNGAMTAIAAGIVRDATAGALATLAPDGAPFVSHVATTASPDGEPLFLLSGLALHTQYFRRDGRASLLLVAPAEGTSDPVQATRLTLTGRVQAPEDGAAAREHFLKVHADAAGYAGFADFAFYRLAFERAHLVAGFGRIASFDAEGAAAIRAAVVGSD